MREFAEILNPSFLLFPALVGSLILGAVAPLVGGYLVLRRTVLLGLTLPQVAAAGIAFTFWLDHAGALGGLHWGERAMGTIGSLLFTFIGMAILGYLERRGRGLTEGRLAAAYALAGALTILFVVFNPAGEIEIISLLKGEVIALSRSEMRLLAVVFAGVGAGMILFRREFLLVSFDRDLAFILKGGTVFWDILLYLLAGVTIAVGVIMAGPLLLFGFLVLPPLAARPLVSGMSAFLWLSSVFGVIMAFFGFYLSYRLDLPLGPTDVAFGCAMVFFAHGAKRLLAHPRLTAVLVLPLLVLSAGCAPRTSLPPPLPKESTLWLGQVKNSTGLALSLPAANPLRAAAEMLGRASPEERPAVPALLRQTIREELERRGFRAAYSEKAREREGAPSGLLLSTDIQLWDSARQFTRVSVDFKLRPAEGGKILWERRIRRAVSTVSATHAGQAHTDAIRAVVQDLLGPSP